MTFTGTLRRVDLGTGGWVLDTGREKLMLVGDVPDGLAGQRVTVEGQALEGMGTIMAGDKAVEVRRISKA